MSSSVRRHIRSFTAKSDGGEVFHIDQYQHFISIRTRGGFTEAPGISEMFTSDGESVNLIEKGVYEIVCHGATCGLLQMTPMLHSII